MSGEQQDQHQENSIGYESEPVAQQLGELAVAQNQPIKSVADAFLEKDIEVALANTRDPARRKRDYEFMKSYQARQAEVRRLSLAGKQSRNLKP